MVDSTFDVTMVKLVGVFSKALKELIDYKKLEKIREEDVLILQNQKNVNDSAKVIIVFFEVKDDYIFNFYQINLLSISWSYTKER